MKRNDLEKSVALRTGESRRTIRQRGFSLLDESNSASDDVVLGFDCPACGAIVNLPDQQTMKLPELVECGSCDSAYPYAEHELNAVDRYVSTSVGDELLLLA